MPALKETLLLVCCELECVCVYLLVSSLGWIGLLLSNLFFWL